MPLIGRGDDDKVSIWDSPTERYRKEQIKQQQEREVEDTVKVIGSNEAPSAWAAAREEEVPEVTVPEWDAYRAAGIETLRESLITARDALEIAEAWVKEISIVPRDAVPIIKDLAHKSRMVVDELKDVR